MKLTKLLLTGLMLLQTSLIWANEEFPLRDLYLKVQHMELEELYNKREQVLIFDVRSSYEYDTLHIKGAQHLALNDREFVTALRKLRNSDQRPLVFYCNGHTCKKSYKAAQKARQGHIDNVYAYDAGIFDWTKAHPDEAVLLGQSPVNPASLLNKEKLNAHMMEPEAFGTRVGDNTITLDIRDTHQKDALNLFPMQQRSVPLDNNKLKTYVDKAKATKKTLMIYDAVGKQVRWLQYFLESEGLTDYYFMKGGATAFLKY